ncbi:FecR family protein [Pseudomonas sp. 21LCFQ02]|uniref:FecR domain-containing protein n=1 Tax=Pseudomonas sp. 21LCFQ02 TaxID=2957505 RepID=UPI00209B1DF9|nr:FecR family protein [Pseudomonas sp. 21LCFQ02]MCO8170957.1 FecR family protein [Pseudomonas sp. 21LCFQ02]
MSRADQRSINEAAQWMALLQSGHASPEELQAFAAWRDSHPRHAEIVSRMGGGLKHIPLDALRNVPRKAVLGSVNSPSSRRQFLGKSLTVAGLGIATLGLGRLYGFIPVPGELLTATGERRSLRLDDGSALTLNARTRIEVQFDATQRLLLLRSGELLVDVARDPQRPFVVQTRHGRMRALGTRFMVRSHDDRTQLVMLHSEVDLSTGSGQRQVVKAGETASFDDRGYLALAPASGAENAWIDGLLEVRDTPLGEVVEQLRSYRRGIIVLDPQLAPLRISGLFFLDDSDRTLQLLEHSLPVSIRYRTPYWVNIEPRA